MKRRSLTVAAIAAASALILAGCSGSPDNNGENNGENNGSANTELLYSGFGGSYEESLRSALLDPFTAATGITVKTDTDGGYVAKLAETVNAGQPSPDVMDTEDRTLYELLAQDLILPLDFDQLDTSDIAYPELITDYSVPWYQFSRNLFWNTDAFPDNPPDTWEKIWDVETYPGLRAFPNRVTGVLEVALLADGVPLDQIYPIDMDRAFKKLDEIKEYSIFAWPIDQQIAQGEAVLGLHTLGRIHDIQEGGTNLAYNWNGAAVSVEQLTITKNASNVEGAHKLIAQSLQSESQLAILDALSYTPTLRSALDSIDTDRLKDLPGTDLTRPTSFYINGEWYAEHGPELMKRWEEWLNAG